MTASRPLVIPVSVLGGYAWYLVAMFGSPHGTVAAVIGLAWMLVGWAVLGWRWGPLGVGAAAASVAGRILVAAALDPIATCQELSLPASTVGTPPA